jgi:acyl carrier protein
MSAHMRLWIDDDTDAMYAVVASCLGFARERLTADTSLVEDLGIDSVDLLALGVELEKEFDVVISDEALFCIRTVGDAVSCIALARELRPIGDGPRRSEPANRFST